MQNIFITFEAESPQYLYTRNPLHFYERGDIQYFIDLQTIIRAKRDCKSTKNPPYSQVKSIHFEVFKHFQIKKATQINGWPALTKKNLFYPLFYNNFKRFCSCLCLDFNDIHSRRK